MPDESEIKQSREEFAEARKTLVDMLVAQHPGTTHQQGDGVKIADLAGHFKTLAENQINADREAGARALGISLEEFDALKAPKQEESTPQSRTAALPSGRTAPPPAAQANTDREGGLTGLDLIEQAANEDYAKFFVR